ncbi:MAG: CehA/McbA family metallohydrolase [Clostridia bacterium]|nr:CehA/McbA family metallohydrolase [Clostridia bacterium]
MKKTTFITEGKWYKGNTHMHTTRSDGKRTPEEAIEIYKNLGYDFLVMSDHNLYFNNNKFDSNKFLILSGIEFNTNDRQNPHRTHHITALKKYTEKDEFTDDQRFEWPFWDDEFGYQVTNKLIENVNAHDNFTILAHPNWSCSYPEELLGLQNFNAIEVWNNECEAVSTTGNGEYYYDYLLKKGRRVLAIASDDVHSYNDRAIGGYIVVKAAQFTKESLAASIISGSYYSSTGPEIHQFYIEDNVVHAKGSDCESIRLVFHYRGKTFYGNKNESINEISYNLNGNERYVRCEFIDHHGKKAWSNPIYLD